MMQDTNSLLTPKADNRGAAHCSKSLARVAVVGAGVA